jgi:plasmid maintenance system antidote protein VapI
METPIRKYKIKDVDFIITADTIIESASKKQPFLVKKRANWTPDFFEEIKQLIEKATQNHLGVDSAKKLRDATQTVYTIANQANRLLAELKVQIEEDFKDNKTQKLEILNNLGFTAYNTAAKTGDQEAMINLLYQYKKNLTPDLAIAIVSKGTAQQTLDEISTLADQLKTANVFQESNKGERKEVTAQAINDFNTIYDKIISIARIASKLYSEDKASSDQFSFSKVAKTLNFSKSKTTS